MPPRSQLSPGKSSAGAAKAAATSNANAGSPKSGMSTSQPAGSSTVACPLARKKIQSCDLKTAKIADSAGVAPRSVSIKPGPKPALPPKLPAKKKRIAQSYDLVLETISDFAIEGRSPAGAKYSVIQATAEYAGGCPDHAPLAYLFKPLNPDPGDPVQSATLVHKATLNSKVPGKYWITDKRNLGAGEVLAFFSRNEEQVKQVEVTFCSCGVPKLPETKKVGSWTGLVRVYRNDTIEMALSFPPLKDKTYKKEGERTDKGWESTTTKTNKGQSAYTDTVKRDASGQITGQSSVYQQGWVNQRSTAYERDVTSGIVTAKEPEKKLKIGLSIKRNGEELNALEAVNKWIESYFSFSKMLFETVSDIQDMIPKIGFTFSCDISVLEGEIHGSVGTRPEKAWDSEAYKWVTTYGSIGFDLKLLGVALKFGFGVEVSTPGMLDWLVSRGEKAFELIVGIKGSLTLECHLKAEKTIFGPNDPEEEDTVLASAPVEAVLEVYAQARVTITGRTCDAKAGVEAGITGKGEILLNPLDIRLGYQVKPGTVYAYFRYPGKGQPSPRWEYQIWKQGDEHRKKLLHP